MSNARDRAQSLRARDAKAAEDDSEAPETAVEPKRSIAAQAVVGKKVRQTVDLSHQRHVELAAWRMETALALGRTRITTQDVLKAAVDAILRDPVVARHVRAQLEDLEDQ